jgi:serine/threonine-protein kinase
MTPESPSEHFPPQRPDIFRVGEVLSEAYLLRKLLGAGGMGQVFEAEDLGLRRRVAIKAHWRDMQHYSIRKEAQALAAIRHPSIATVHGVGVHEGIEYVVMERIHGLTLADHIHRRQTVRSLLPISEVIEILALLADGLAAVHHAGIAHRDVKPANVMLAPGGRLVLMDFGIMLPEFAATGEEIAPGTAEYMAPEVFLRNLEPGRAFLLDVYAFGVVAHELVTGRRPFDAPTLGTLLQKHIAHAPPTLLRLRPDVPPALDAVVASCLAKDPHDRPQSMDLVASALRRVRVNATRTVRSRLSVLVVEDDPAFAEVLAGVVRDAVDDVLVTVVPDGEAALEHLRQRPPDLMLLDLGLPGMSGVELCMYARGTRMADLTTVVAVSAAARPPDVALLRQLGVRHFLPKNGELVERLDSLVRTLRS